MSVEFSRVSNQEDYLLRTPTEYSSLSELNNDVYAIDFLVEWNRVHEHLPDLSEQTALEFKRKRFIDNLETHPKEAMGVQVGTFPPYEIRYTSEGITLFQEGYNGPIREIYNPDNPNMKHLWPKSRQSGINYERAKIEYNTFCDFEQSLELYNAQEGDSFIWISMPPTEILEDTQLSQTQKQELLKELGYDFHSNVFVMTIEKGRLQGRVVQDYLNTQDHQQLLLEVVEGYEAEDIPTDLTLLSMIKKVKKGVDVGYIQDRVNELYKETDDTLRLPAPERTKNADMWLQEREFEEALAEARPLLETLFYMLYHADRYDLESQSIRDIIAEQSDAWQKTIMSFINKDPVHSDDLELLRSLSSADLDAIARLKLHSTTMFNEHLTHTNDRLYSAQTMFRHFGQLDYIVPESGCGTGTGWGSLSEPIEGMYGLSSSAPMTYGGAEILTGNTKKEFDGKCVNCPNCKKTVDAIVTKEIIKCPSCKHTVKRK